MTTHGGLADRQGLRRRNAGGAQHVLRKGLRSLDPRRRGARSEHRDPVPSQFVGDARDERSLRPDHGQLGAQRHGEPEQTVAVVRTHRMAHAER